MLFVELPPPHVIYSEKLKKTQDNIKKTNNKIMHVQNCQGIPPQ